MPVFNGESYTGRSICVVSKFLKHYSFPYEIIVVDDDSTDETRSHAEKAASKYDNVRVTGYSRNCGKGIAFLYGYKYSQGGIIALFDADLDIPTQQIPVLLAVMRKTKASINSLKKDAVS